MRLLTWSQTLKVEFQGKVCFKNFQRITRHVLLNQCVYYLNLEVCSLVSRSLGLKEGSSNLQIVGYLSY
jgi:hypothetical protein